MLTAAGFDVVCPAIPGYGFSEAPAKPGFGVWACAEVFHELMTEVLGIGSYVAQARALSCALC